MDLLATLQERYPGKEFSPAPANLSLGPMPSHGCPGPTKAFIVKDGPIKTAQIGKRLHLQRKFVQICAFCGQDGGIVEVSERLEKEAV